MATSLKGYRGLARDINRFRDAQGTLKAIIFSAKQEGRQLTPSSLHAGCHPLSPHMYTLLPAFSIKSLLQMKKNGACHQADMSKWPAPGPIHDNIRNPTSPMHSPWPWLDNVRWPKKFSRLEQQGWERDSALALAAKRPSAKPRLWASFCLWYNADADNTSLGVGGIKWKLGRGGNGCEDKAEIPVTRSQQLLGEGIAVAVLVTVT